MRNVSGKICSENKIKKHFCSITFFWQPYRLWDNVEKCSRAGQATDDNMAHAHCMLGTQAYKHKLRICNTYCYSTATNVVGTRLNVTLYVHCLFVCLFFQKPKDWSTDLLVGWNGCQNGFLSLAEQNKLRVFWKKVLRRIFGLNPLPANV